MRQRWPALSAQEHVHLSPAGPQIHSFFLVSPVKLSSSGRQCQGREAICLGNSKAKPGNRHPSNITSGKYKRSIGPTSGLGQPMTLTTQQHEQSRLGRGPSPIDIYKLLAGREDGPAPDPPAAVPSSAAVRLPLRWELGWNQGPGLVAHSLMRWCAMAKGGGTKKPRVSMECCCSTAGGTRQRMQARHGGEGSKERQMKRGMHHQAGAIARHVTNRPTSGIVRCGRVSPCLRKQALQNHMPVLPVHQEKPNISMAAPRSPGRLSSASSSYSPTAALSSALSYHCTSSIYLGGEKERAEVRADGHGKRVKQGSSGLIHGITSRQNDA